ncbi:MAG: hypothetical protein K2K35_11245 [Lachnospiraceae bacterium]|nr:hypothetical protein [Lachnospiraceae bacterium]
MKKGIIYKIACLFKNILQVLSSIICGWISAWWFLASIAFLTDKPDRAEEAADIKISGWIMLLSGIIIIAVKEVIMYKINMDWKKYILFSILPLVITAVAGYYYIIYWK